MDNSIYVTLSRQLALFRDMDVTANNIANSNTYGYNAQKILFESYLAKDINQGSVNTLAYAHNVRTHRDTQAGPLSVTNNALDLAISGEGYFSVDTPLGERYTRAGNFTLSSEGVLITNEGYPVLDEAGQRIQFPDDTRTIEIGTAGNIKVNGEELGNVGVYVFSNPQLLEAAGSNMFRSDIEPENAPASTRVIQGAVEGSNVQPVMELTHMMDVSRSVSSTAKFIETMYELQRNANNTWARPAN